MVATGVVPCSSGIIIMLFALANNAMGVGIAAVVALSLGMAVTVSAVGMLGIVARPHLLRVAQGPGLRVERAERSVKAFRRRGDGRLCWPSHDRGPVPS